MGKIKKTPTERHNATASPAITTFVTNASTISLPQLPSKLAEFPSHWPHPRGDLYHWIPLLDRFDHILELFNEEYGLKDGPQTQPFTQKLLLKGDMEDTTASGVTEKELVGLGFHEDGDGTLIEHILRFTCLLMERCGNRSLYASSEQINSLLHTTSLSLLKLCLQLSLRLAQRYQVARYKNTHPQAQAGLLANHYAFSLDNMHMLALPLAKPRSPVQSLTQTPGRHKDKIASSTFNPADLVAFAKNDFPPSIRKDLATVTITFPKGERPQVAVPDGGPSTPTPDRRQPNRPSAGDRTVSTSSVVETPSKQRDSYFPASLLQTFEISTTEISNQTAPELIKQSLHQVPPEKQYELLNSIRIAKAFTAQDESLQTLLDVRLLAISNLAYAMSESKFQERIGSPDTNEPRRYHLAAQLCDLLQPASNGQRSLSIESQTIVLGTLEALARLKHKSGEIVDALAVTVNHGVIYYELRQAIASLRTDDESNDINKLRLTQWRNAIFDLVTTITGVHSHIKIPEKMVAAGIMEILVEALTLRTSSAERVYEKIMGFLTSFIHGISSAFSALATAHGLEIITDLASYEVTLAMQRVRDGQGMPEDCKSKVVDYQIPYYQQATLRSIFKFVVYLFDHNSGVHDRLLRNLLDSPQTLGALREMIGNADIFGSNVWDAAINTVTNFIHNEPTSFQVIAEAGLAKGILEAVTQKPLSASTDVEVHVYNPDIDDIQAIGDQIQYPEVQGVLPVTETICDIPGAFGAICLNEDGMSMFRASGALDAYLDIFLSPAHVRALEEEGQTAFSIGNAFDELARHHPGLQSRILDAVEYTLRRVHSLATLPEAAASIALVSIPEERHTTDTQMQDADDDKDSFRSDAKMLVNRAPAMPFITTFFKFLEGFFHNSSMCQKFCQRRAVLYILDLITTTANPYDLSIFPVIGKMAHVLHRMAEEKPHLVLPDILARMTASATELETFADSLSPAEVYRTLTSTDGTVSKVLSPEASKAFTNIGALTIVLSRVLNAPSYGSRGAATSMLLTSMNFLDIYIKLFQQLGRLHSWCLRAGISVMEQIQDVWKPFSEAEALSVRNVDTDGVIHTSIHCAHCDFPGMSDRTRFMQSLEHDGKADNSKITAFRNVRAFRFLSSQTPLAIESLFQSMAQVMTPKRHADLLPKYNAFAMAYGLATAITPWLKDCERLTKPNVGELRYVNANLTAVHKILLKTATAMDSFGSKEACTLVLWKFFDAGGFDNLNSCQLALTTILSNDDNHDKDVCEEAIHGMTTLLSFFAQVCRTKCIQEAAQTVPIQRREVERSDYFHPGQFLVEVRESVLRSIGTIWKSDNLTKIGLPNIKLIIEIMRNVLKSDGEDRAAKRSDNLTRPHSFVAPVDSRFWTEMIPTLSETTAASEDLVQEAIFRCNEHERNAEEYIRLRLDHSAPRFAVPSGANRTLPTSSDITSVSPGASPSVAVPQSSGDAARHGSDSDESMSDDMNNGSLGRLPQDVAQQSLAEFADAELFPRSMLLGDTTNESTEKTKQPFVTVDDLNDQRELLRASLIDRCLEILSVETQVSFELSDLIEAAVGKADAPRSDWGNTLVSSLLSLQAEEPSAATGQKIAAYAHLVALVLQHHDFFLSTLDELKDNFDCLVSWIEIAPSQKAEDSPWIDMILLILERVLAEDELPAQITWLEPPANEPFKVMPEPELAEPIVSDDSRSTLFSALLDMLPKVGKNGVLALSISRVLVILTRRRALAGLLCEKRNLSRLFLMIRQVGGPLGEKLQSTFMLILRHLVEDEDSIRQTMRTEIKTMFDSHRSGSRGIDTTAYARNLHHLVHRDPKLFIETTKEMVEIVNFNGQAHRPNQLALRKQIGAETNDEPSVEQEAQDSGLSKQTRIVDDKPAVESADGIVQYLLRELSNFKDVEDRALPAKLNTQSTDDHANDPTAPGTSTSDVSNDINDIRAAEKGSTSFRAEDNVIYIYRCFIMQCLAELLACYTRLKLDFINFSRKADTQAGTPSKPRSGTINYLLNQLLPVGSLEYKDDTMHRKKLATSDSATNLLVALCTQTHEQPYFERHAPREPSIDGADPDLMFVRRFVLEHAIRSFKEAVTNSESLDMRYSRLLALADLFDRMLHIKPDRHHAVQSVVHTRQLYQVGHLMCEKNFIGVLTSAISELDLNFPNSKRAVKHILGPLKILTELAVTFSQRGELTSSNPSTSAEEDEISSATSVSDADEANDDREQTPDLFRNSTLSMYETSGMHPDESSSDEEDDDDEDEEMFEGGFEEEMDYEDGNGETISDDDDDLEGMEGLDDMGDIEGLPGDMHMEVEIVEDDVETEDDDEEDDVTEDDEDEDVDDGDNDDYYDELDEINGDEENASLADMQEGAWEENADFDPEIHDDGDGSPRDPIAQIAADILGGDDHSDHGRGPAMIIDDGRADFFDDEMAPEDDEEEADEDDYEGEFGYEPEIEEDDDEDAGYLDFFQHAPAFANRLHRRRGLEDIIGGGPGLGHVRPPQPMHYHRRAYHNEQQPADQVGVNPLLVRQDQSGIRDRAGFDTLHAFMPPVRRWGLGRGGQDTAMFEEFIAAVGGHAQMAPNGGHVTVTMDAAGHINGGLGMRHLSRLFNYEPNRPFREQFALSVPQNNSRSSSSEEAQAVEFKAAKTNVRWEEESLMLFNSKANDHALRIINSMLKVLVPPAMEAKRLKDIEEAERKAAQERAREEEERKAAALAEREAEERRKQEEEEAQHAAELVAQQSVSEQTLEADSQMSGTGAEQQSNDDVIVPTEPESERRFTTIRGQRVDITNLGIDNEYLEALPEEFREEVIMSQFAEQRSQAQQAGEAPNEISREFLAALPPEIQAELLRQEAQDRRRRERTEAAARRNTEAGNARPAQAQEMDPVDFLAMLDPTLRQSILMEAHADEGYLSSLPEEVQEQARALYGDRPPRDQVFQMEPGVGPRLVNINGRAVQPDATGEKTRIRPVLQMLDKAGVATLLRLMFITLHQTAKTSLRSILSDVCKNTQNRAEVISILLSILQDGTADVNAVERSFAQLSLRAKQNPGPKTPQPLKRSLTGQLIQPVTELSPLNIVQQCLSTLASLSSDNPKVQLFFLSEHETLASHRVKGAEKGKSKENTAAKYPLNALLTLLDRKLITENTGVMETLATLLSRVTSPLQILLKKAKQEQKNNEAAVPDVPDVQNTEQSAAANDQMDVTPDNQVDDKAATQGAKSEDQKKKRGLRELKAPIVPEENVRLVVNILAARDCPTKTFSDTLDIIKHMAAIPGAKEVFGKELIRQAAELGASVVSDLNDLTQQITTAQTGADIQGLALVSFSSAGSKQRKLLRILVALDHLFDSKRMAVFADGSASADSKLKDDILATLYESETFQTLWKNLSLCLTAIRQRGDLVNVATILLPLIESLMVVCRNSSLKDTAINASQAEVTVSTPPPEARMEGLFFTFTEEHRKILNELIRNNPKLMNGNLSVLAKNSKVLEFDNKRNYFNRKLHNRGSDVRVAHPPLTLNVRRDEVFMDSYKALFFKSGEEIKNGKLNIRFNGEEGIDAGGVTREWFSVMARQMFNPNFALFNPVASDRTTFHPNRLSDVNEEHLPFFKFIGRVIGKALYEGRVLDCHFSRAVYRRILGKSVSLKDMESLDLEYYKSLVWILENDITDITFETFSVEVDRFGEVEIVDLIPDGRNVAVTEDNKQEYVRLVVEHRLIKSVEEQLNAFLKGFHDIIPAELISIFNEQELELLISGLPEIDVDDWKNNTEYHNYQPTAAQIQWFWRAVKSFDPEERAKLLQFVTGTSKVPLNGFKELEGMNGFARFNIHRDYSSKEKLPTSHTCFNQLDLPEYESYEHLRQQLYTAITAGSEYFGFA